MFAWLGPGDVARENRVAIIAGLAAGTSIALLAYADCEDTRQPGRII